MKKTIPTKKDFSTGGVVWDAQNQKILLIRVENLSGDHAWTFPKGHPEAGEDEPTSALREVLEETGWRCEIVSKLTDVHYFYIHDGTRFSKTVLWFLMRPVEKTGEFDPEEVLETKWVGLSEAKEMVTYGSDKELLKQTSLLL